MTLEWNEGTKCTDIEMSPGRFLLTRLVAGVSCLGFTGGDDPTIFPGITSLLSESEIAQLCPTICNLVDSNLPGFSVHGILQARVLEWIAISLSKAVDAAT